MSKMLASVCLLGFLFFASNAQTPPAETGPDIDLLHHLRRSTVSLGLRQTDGRKSRFATVGSAVIILLDENHGCLLTAKHVFYDPDKGFQPTILYLRIPQNEPRSEDDLGVELKLVANGQNLWHGSAEADLAVVPLPDLSKYKDLHAIRIADFGDEEDVFQGAQVAVMGYPELLGPGYQTTPIARNGIVAWTSPEGALDHTFLVDANIFNGNSGGPVFHMPNGVTRSGSIFVGGAAKLIGIVSKDAYEEAPVHLGPVPLSATNRQTGEVIPMQAKVLNIGGIGVVEPISKARKLIESTFSTR